MILPCRAASRRTPVVPGTFGFTGRKRLERARLERDPGAFLAPGDQLSISRSMPRALPVFCRNQRPRRRAGHRPWRARSGRACVQELVDDQFFFHADDAVVRTSHADVGDVGSSFRENAFVCGGTWVCVPTTAVTRPSRYSRGEIFSEVASAWKSTKIILASTFCKSWSAVRKGRRSKP